MREIGLWPRVRSGLVCFVTGSLQWHLIKLWLSLIIDGIVDAVTISRGLNLM
jgi:hypothetical protein